MAIFEREFPYFEIGKPLELLWSGPNCLGKHFHYGIIRFKNSWYLHQNVHKMLYE